MTYLVLLMGHKTAVKRHRVRQIVTLPLRRGQQSTAETAVREPVLVAVLLRRGTRRVKSVHCCEPFIFVLLRRTAKMEEDYISKLKNFSKLDFQSKGEVINNVCVRACVCVCEEC